MLRPLGQLAAGAALLLALGVSVTPCSAAMPASWNDTLYSYRGEASTLGERLQAFARTMGLRLSLRDGALTRAPVPFDPHAAQASVYLDRLAAAQRFQWFVYHGVLYVSAADAQVTERVSLAGLDSAGARQALEGLGLFESKFGWGGGDDSNSTVIVAGPPDYVRLLKSVLEHKDENKETPQPMLFRLKYALAADHQTTVREQLLIQPGVATLLSQMVAGRRPEPFGGPGPIALARAAQRNEPVPPGAPPAAPVPATVEAYAPLNAVLVRDLPERRAMYQDLIMALDVPVEQVEILVTIVDAKRGTLRDWSAGLSLQGGKMGGRFSHAGGDAEQGGANLVLWSLGKLNLEMRALESEGALRVVSRPSLLTLDNVDAVLDMSQSAYVKLLGERTADLKSLTAGTLLKVTPRVIADAADPTIHLLVDIEDGRLITAGDGSSSATTERNSISTQALVHPGQALVVGGYRREQTQNGQERVPVLSKIPLLGRLFSADSDKKDELERLFILTARVVGHDAAADATLPVPSASHSDKG
ncbi:type III secretion system outer membrane ring subunit SctC [Pseudoduganella sp. R-43]|uniref:type III secretion system outer membrane ring subunit SctC n=1 Tax=unclassified Pseudoduganella TaxID=2637179 RepID=UPI003CF9BEF1